jgi:hypothetical protein
MRIVAKNEIEKFISLIVRIRKEQVVPFKPSRLYPEYMFWNRSGSEQSKMYPVYATPAPLVEAEELIPETAL